MQPVNLKDVVDEEDLDLKDVLLKKPPDRQRWLTRVLKVVKDGRVKNLTVLFDILAHRRFQADLDIYIGRRMGREVLINAHIFSFKQQQFLKSSNWCLAKFCEGLLEEMEQRRLEEQEQASEEEEEVPATVPSDAARALALSAAPAAPSKPMMSFKAAPRRAAEVAAAFGDDEKGDELRASHLKAMRNTHQKKADELELPTVFKQQKPTMQEASNQIYLPQQSPRMMKADGGTRVVTQFDAQFQQKRKVVSSKNPTHEGLEDIKASVLKERGIVRRRSRTRSRSRRRDRERERPSSKNTGHGALEDAKPRSRSRDREQKEQGRSEGGQRKFRER